MNFDEMTYFVKDESGGYCYAIGKRKAIYKELQSK